MFIAKRWGTVSLQSISLKNASSIYRYTSEGRAIGYDDDLLEEQQNLPEFQQFLPDLKKLFFACYHERIQNKRTNGVQKGGRLV